MLLAHQETRIETVSVAGTFPPYLAAVIDTPFFYTHPPHGTQQFLEEFLGNKGGQFAGGLSIPGWLEFFTASILSNYSTVTITAAP